MSGAKGGGFLDRTEQAFNWSAFEALLAPITLRTGAREAIRPWRCSRSCFWSNGIRSPIRGGSARRRVCSGPGVDVQALLDKRCRPRECHGCGRLKAPRFRGPTPCQGSRQSVSTSLRSPTRPEGCSARQRRTEKVSPSAGFPVRPGRAVELAACLRHAQCANREDSEDTGCKKGEGIRNVPGRAASE